MIQCGRCRSRDSETESRPICDMRVRRMFRSQDWSSANEGGTERTVSPMPLEGSDNTGVVDSREFGEREVVIRAALIE